MMFMDVSQNRFLVARRTLVVTKTIPIVGGENAADTFVTGLTSLEGLIDLRPDVIFVPWLNESSNPPRDYYANPYLQMLPAVKNHRVYAMPNLGHPSAILSIIH